MEIPYQELINRVIEYNKTDHSGQRIGVNALDEIMRLDKQDLVICVGRSNNGKSTFMQWYVTRMAQRNNWRTALLSFEGRIELTVTKMLSIAKDPDTIKNHMSFRTIPVIKSVDDVIEDMKEAKEHRDIDCYVIDPYSNLLLGNVDTYTIAQDLAKLQQTAQELDICLVLLAHPTKNAEIVDGYAIKGSSSFMERADVLFSVESDFKNSETTIKVQKLRENEIRGKVGRECTLSFSKHDFSFGDGTEIDTTPNQAGEHHAERQEIDIETIKNIMVNVYKNSTDRNPTHKASLLDALTVPESDKMKIIELRTKTRNVPGFDKQDYKQKHLPLCSISANFNTPSRTKDSINQYTNIIAIDIDGKDNPTKTKAELREIVNKIPYVFYSAVSCSGNGLFALVYIDGTQADFKAHFRALEQYFRLRGVIIDTACKDITRLRYQTYDRHPYFNPHALVFTERMEDPRRQIKTLTEKIANHPPQAQDTAKELDKLTRLLRYCQRNKVVINKTHSDTLTMSRAIATDIGESGYNILHDFQSIKHPSGFNDHTLESTFNHDCENKGQTHVGSIYRLFKEATGTSKINWNNID